MLHFPRFKNITNIVEFSQEYLRNTLINLEKYDEAETHIYNCSESGAGMGSPILAALIKKKKNTSGWLKHQAFIYVSSGVWEVQNQDCSWLLVDF